MRRPSALAPGGCYRSAVPIPDEVLGRIAATALELADTPELDTFLLGVAADSVRESAALGADAVVDVFRTDDPEEAREVLTHLEATLEAHPRRRTLRIDNAPLPPSAGSGGTLRVYVALWALS